MLCWCRELRRSLRSQDSSRTTARGFSTSPSRSLTSRRQWRGFATAVCSGCGCGGRGDPPGFLTTRAGLRCQDRVNRAAGRQLHRLFSAAVIPGIQKAGPLLKFGDGVGAKGTRSSKTRSSSRSGPDAGSPNFIEHRVAARRIPPRSAGGTGRGIDLEPDRCSTYPQVPYL
jgi:hypothetical protein